MKFQNHHNRDQFPDRGHEKNSLPSETVPNQSLTVRELVYRFTHNMDLNAGMNRSYDDDDEIGIPANWNQLDLSEKMQFLNDKKTEAEGIVEKINARRNAEEKARRDKEVDELAEKKLQAHKDAIAAGKAQ